MLFWDFLTERKECMNKKLKLCLALLAFVLIIVLAGAGYRFLSGNYDKEKGVANKLQTQDTNPQTQIHKTQQQEQNDSQKPLIKAVDFTVFDRQENEIKLLDKTDRPVIVNFWATWCGPCKMEMPAFELLYHEYKDEINFMMVNLTDGYRDTVQKVDKFIADNEYTFPVYYDLNSEAAYTYGVSSVPATLFINSRGEIVNGIIGAMDQQTLREYIEMLIGDDNE